MKKLTVILLAALFFCLSPAYATTTDQNSGITWSVDGTTLTISGEGAIPDYAAPNHNFNNESTAPWYGMDIEKVIIEEGVTRIGKYAFGEMKNLKTVELPSTVAEVGCWAFAQCPITSITFSEPVYLECDVFEWCKELHSIIFESPVTLSGGSLSSCPSLTALHFPDGTTDLGVSPFYNGAMKAVWIPDSVQNGEDNTRPSSKIFLQM